MHIRTEVIISEYVLNYPDILPALMKTHFHTNSCTDKIKITVKYIFYEVNFWGWKLDNAFIMKEKRCGILSPRSLNLIILKAALIIFMKFSHDCLLRIQSTCN